ncbi:GPO family capsid scaffolding protein [Rhodospira trueperi]|uniref:Phage capsid scaffolding protein (GPO) serine peptidase n=1 Tax=Rhodospira trueperi TaxID=69960 RepID=A0A1G7HVT2_9PROT|nr:GPO family capsid scaffolding protein [Rhodospira trueperi]SDF04552.1 Phage capsid scaffolding protein (GPO) serine peptidase [Rhodospira trueperi]
MRTKWFKVCQSGRTIDGREITPQQIDEMAETYNPRTYGARVFVEHLRSIVPESPLSALGDVLALRAETDAATGARVLLAQVDATDRLVTLAQNRDKSYWSIEMAPNMAGTGKAYMVGLSVTDTPASLGTELIKLSATAGTLPEPMRDHLFSEALELAGPLPGPSAEDGADPGFMDRIRQLLSGEGRKTDARLTGMESALIELAGAVGSLTAFASHSPAPAAVPPTQPPATAAGASSPASAGAPAQPAAPESDPVTAPIAALGARLDQLVEALSHTPALAGRPLSAGGTSTTHATDC